MQTIVLGGFLIIVFTVIPGLWLWWPKRTDAVSRSDLGVALMTGALIAVAVLAIQVSIDEKARKREETRQETDARQNFELTLSLQQDLSGIRLDRDDLRGLNFFGKTMRRASLNRALMHNVVLSNAILEEATLQRTIMPGALMDGAILTDAHLENADMTGAILTRARMRRAQLDGAHLETADLTNARLLYADLTGAHLEGASLSNAILFGTNMTNATWDSDTGFEGAQYDRSTIWPAGIKQRPCRQTVCYAVNPPQ
jgi:uncharacterized protein YjbI with pentapeptide repeats